MKRLQQDVNGSSAKENDNSLQQQNWCGALQKVMIPKAMRVDCVSVLAHYYTIHNQIWGLFSECAANSPSLLKMILIERPEEKQNMGRIYQLEREKSICGSQKIKKFKDWPRSS